MAKHYAVLDENGVIIDAFSDALRKPSGNNILIKENGDRHIDFQVRDEKMLYAYKWDGSKRVQRTEDEKQPIAELKQSVLDHIERIAKGLLDKTDWKVIRHLEEKSAAVPASMTDESFTTLVAERKAVRDKMINLYQQVNAMNDRSNIDTFVADFDS